MSSTPSHSSATARDSTNYSYDLSNAIYGAFPSCATDLSPRRSRAASPASASNSSKKRGTAGMTTANSTGTKTRTHCHQSISLHRTNAPPTWLPAPNPINGRSALARRQQGGINIHASTCLNLNASSEEESSEADLWILPELDDWEEDETEAESTILTPSSSAELDAATGSATGGLENKWAGVLRRAANSNLERLRTRMEGDGWDFVKPANQDHEDLDEEFDVVVLSGPRRND
ncbi:hypothetical protein J4E91_010461 [Alternaria rosae]|nr:hypothetical protein J4E91_010461 [Alternaria rosae]